MLECTPLTCRARSSTAEQWPFKPLVESSNLSALTQFHPHRTVSSYPEGRCRPLRVTVPTRLLDSNQDRRRFACDLLSFWSGEVARVAGIQHAHELGGNVGI